MYVLPSKTVHKRRSDRGPLEQAIEDLSKFLIDTLSSRMHAFLLFKLPRLLLLLLLGPFLTTNRTSTILIGTTTPLEPRTLLLLCFLMVLCSLDLAQVFSLFFLAVCELVPEESLSCCSFDGCASHKDEVKQ